MAIGVKVDPRVIVSGTVVAIAPRTAFVSPEDRANGLVGPVERHDVLIAQSDGGQLQVRYRERDGIPLPQVGSYVALDTRVNEGTFRDDRGAERAFVSLVVAGSAAGELDLIHSNLTNSK